MPKHYHLLNQVTCQPNPETTLAYFGGPRLADRPPTVGSFQNLERLGHGQNREAFIRLRPLDS